MWRGTFPLGFVCSAHIRVGSKHFRRWGKRLLNMRGKLLLIAFLLLSLLYIACWMRLFGLAMNPGLGFNAMWDQLGNQQCEQNFTAASLPRLDLESCCHPQQSVPFQSTEKLPAVGTASPGLWELQDFSKAACGCAQGHKSKL